MDVVHDIANKKFIATVEGGEAHILYRRGPQNSYELYSTLVPPVARGKNIADQMLRAALKEIAKENVKVIATCPYVVAWFRKHPEEQGILFRGDRANPTL